MDLTSLGGLGLRLARVRGGFKVATVLFGVGRHGRGQAQEALVWLLRATGVKWFIFEYQLGRIGLWGRR